MVDWDNITEASELEKAGADVLLRASDGGERRAPYDGGWVNFADSVHTASSKWAIPADVKSLIEIDGLGSGTETRFLRSLNSDVWSANTIRPSAVGEAYTVRITMKLSKSSSSQQNINIGLFIGDAWAVNIANQHQQLVKGSGVTDLITASFDIFCLETFGRYGGRFYLTPSDDIQVWDKAIYIRKEFTP